MSRLSDIPIRVEPLEGGAALREAGPTEAAPTRTPNSAVTGTIGGGAAALLTEIATLLARAAESGESQAIDLRSLPMSAAERAQLLAALGPGEVEITLRADGESTIRETSVRGVWWTEHRDREGAVVAAFIEIGAVPAILVVDADELRGGAERLRQSATGPRSNRGEQAYVQA